MTPADPRAMETPPATQTPSPRDNMERLARTLQLDLGPAADAGLAFRIGQRVPATVAPGRNGRLVALLRIAEAAQVPPTVWISALSEAAGWGLDGERQRFVVVDGQFALLWTTPPLPGDAWLEQLYELFATAVALADMVDTAAP
jgi:hypothetical protein